MDENKEKELLEEENAEKLTEQEKEEVSEILEELKNREDEAQVVTDWDGLAQVGDDGTILEDTDTEETEEEESDGDDEEEIQEGSLCERCGKRERYTELDEDYPYCKACREDMKKTRMNGWGVFFFIACVLACIGYVVSGICMGVISAPVIKGDIYMSQNKFNSAITAYEEALATIDEVNQAGGAEIFDAGSRTYAKLVKAYRNMGSTIYAQNYFSYLGSSDVLDKISYAETKEYYDEYEKMMNTYSELQNTYAEHVNKFYAMKEKPDVSEAEKYLNELEELKKDEKYDPYMVTYFQYILCTVTENSLDKGIGYLEEIKEGGRAYEFIYSIELSMAYLEKGEYEKAEALCYESLEASPENVGVYQYLMMSKRRQGDYEGALKLAREAEKLAKTIYTGEEDRTALPYNIPMEEAIVYALMGEKEKAIAAIDASYELGNDNSNLNIMVLLHYLYHVEGTKPTENEDGEKIYDNVDEMYDMGLATISYYGSYYGLSVSENVQAIMDGKKTLEDVFIKGEVDWQ